MPIVRKLEDLKMFCAKLMDKHNTATIGLHTLEYEISIEFGFSKYIQDNVKHALIKFGLLKVTGSGQFEIMILKSKKDLEKEAEDELKTLGIE